MSDISVTVFEQPGALGEMKARRLCAFFEQFYAENKEEVDRLAEELRQRKGVVSCPSGSMFLDTSL